MAERSAQITLTLLGTIELTVDERTVPYFATHKACALFAYLALESDQPLRRESVAALLWPDIDHTSSLTSLRSTLYRLRQQFNKVEPKLGSRLIIGTRQTVRLNHELISVDALLIQGLIRQTETHSHTTLAQCEACLACLLQASSLYQGEFMAGFGLPDAPQFDQWLHYQREKFRQHAIVGLEQLSRAYISLEKYEDAQKSLEKILKIDPYHEESYCQQMRLLVSMGHRVAALQQYEQCRQALREGLDVEPSQTTYKLYQEILDGKFERQSGLPPIRDELGVDHFRKEIGMTSAISQAILTHNWHEMPAVDIFYGRAIELEKLLRWLLVDGCRLVNVLGMGGIGKTTFTARTAQEVGNKFDVVIWHSLTNRPPLEALLTNWLGTLIPQTATNAAQSLDQQLALLLACLAQKRCLLILDNLESILHPGESGTVLAGRFLSSYETYSQLLTQIGNNDHKSCLLLTSREQPYLMNRMQGANVSVHNLYLGGLDSVAGAEVLGACGLMATKEQAGQLVQHYSGNPMALQIVANTIIDLYGGDVDFFLQEDVPIFDDIRVVLDEQFQRLSIEEREILTLFTADGGPLSMAVLQSHLSDRMSRYRLLESVRSLQRRSFLMPIQGESAAAKSAAHFALQNVVMKYMIQR